MAVQMKELEYDSYLYIRTKVRSRPYQTVRREYAAGDG